MLEKSPSKMLWHQALTGGLILGAALFAWEFIVYLTGMQSFASSLIQVVILAAGIVWFGNKLKIQRGPELGFSYGTSFGFVMALMLCAGAVSGVGEFFLQVVIAPEYYEEAYEIALLNTGFDESLLEQVMDIRKSGLFKNPLTFMFSGVFALVFLGGFIGLILSAFLQKPADPFAGRDNEYNPEA